MLKTGLKQLFCGFLLFVITLVFCGQNTVQAEDVSVSKTGYEVFVETGNTFVGNKIPMGSELGTEYFMTYTVKNVKHSSLQQGLCGTASPSQEYPFDPDGFLRFGNLTDENQSENLILPGATYYLKFTIAKGCFRYNVARNVNGKKENIYFEEYAGTAESKMQYFGIWLGETPETQVQLTDVHCYDAKGNDLGVQLTEGHGKVVDTVKHDEMITLQKDTKVNHRYEITVENQKCVAISHVKEPASSKVYLEYQVKSVNYKFDQEGISISDSPLDVYPYARGKLLFNDYFNQTPNNLWLLEKGAEYIICMEKTSDGFEVFAQKSIHGKTMFHTFEETVEFNQNPDPTFFSLWFGDVPAGSFQLTNLKFYDEEKNNLGVQCNQQATIIHYGEMENYEGCEATYYCEETGDIIALFRNQQLKSEWNGTQYEGTYSIVENVMTANIGGKTEKFDYYYARMIDENGNLYHRLRHYTVRFITGNETKIAPHVLSNATGYTVSKPSDPILEGYVFEGWCLKDGTPFEFHKIQTESVTLYAKYSGDGGVIYLPSGDEAEAPTSISNYGLLIAGVVLVLAAVAFCVVCVKKGVANGRKDEKNNQAEKTD